MSTNFIPPHVVAARLLRADAEERAEKREKRFARVKKVGRWALVPFRLTYALVKLARLMAQPRDEDEATR